MAALPSGARHDSLFVQFVMRPSSPGLELRGAVVNGVVYGDASTILTLVHTDEVERERRVTLVLQLYPNPFAEQTTIAIQSIQTGWHQLRIFDMLGRQVHHEAVYVDANQKLYRQQWRVLASASSGVYRIHLANPHGESTGWCCKNTSYLGAIAYMLSVCWDLKTGGAMSEKQRLILGLTICAVLLAGLFFMPWRITASDELAWGPMYRPPVSHALSYQHSTPGARYTYETAERALGVYVLQLLAIGAIGGIAYRLRVGTAEGGDLAAEEDLGLADTT